MRTLRGFLQGKILIVYIVVPALLASSLVIINSRPSFAESSSLLRTVRCVVRTVLWVECPKNVTSSTQQPAPTQAPQPANPTPPPAATPSNTSSIPVNTSSKVQVQEVSAPNQTLAQYEPLEQVPVTASTTSRMSESEYVAYFNRYSPYAVAAAQTMKPAPVERTSEGWRLFGTAWYWWGILAAIGFVLFFAFKHNVLRKRSVLPKAE